MRLVVLASGAGSTLQAFLDACADPAYGAQVVAVGVDRPDTGAERRARLAGVPVFQVRLEDAPDRASFDAALAAAIGAHSPELVVCAGYMKLVGASVLSRFTLVNTHPALAPAFPGAHAVADALAYGVKVTGVTVHFVDAGVDTGPVIAQAAVAVRDGDDVASLHARIKAVEAPLFVDVVGRIARSGYHRSARTVTLAPAAPARAPVPSGPDPLRGPP